MLCDHCGDCYELLTDVRVLNTLANLLGGRWTMWVCAGSAGTLSGFARFDVVRHQGATWHEYDGP